MSRFRNLSALLVWRRPFVALLAGIALVPAMLAPHDAAVEQAGAVSHPVEIVENAAHPGVPAHVEGAEIKLHPGCVACLLQLGNNAVQSPPPAPLPLLPQGDEIAVPVTRLSSVGPSLPGPARAPPIASPSA